MFTRPVRIVQENNAFFKSNRFLEEKEYKMLKRYEIITTILCQWKRVGTVQQFLLV